MQTWPFLGGAEANKLGNAGVRLDLTVGSNHVSPCHFSNPPRPILSDGQTGIVHYTHLEITSTCTTQSVKTLKYIELSMPIKPQPLIIQADSVCQRSG